MIKIGDRNHFGLKNSDDQTLANRIDRDKIYFCLKWILFVCSIILLFISMVIFIFGLMFLRNYRENSPDGNASLELSEYVHDWNNPLVHLSEYTQEELDELIFGKKFGKKFTINLLLIIGTIGMLTHFIGLCAILIEHLFLVTLYAILMSSQVIIALLFCFFFQIPIVWNQFIFYLLIIIMTFIFAIKIKRSKFNLKK